MHALINFVAEKGRRDGKKLLMLCIRRRRDREKERHVYPILADASKSRAKSLRASPDMRSCRPRNIHHRRSTSRREQHEEEEEEDGEQRGAARKGDNGNKQSSFL